MRGERQRFHILPRISIAVSVKKKGMHCSSNNARLRKEVILGRILTEGCECLSEMIAILAYLPFLKTTIMISNARKAIARTKR